MKLLVAVASAAEPLVLKTLVDRLTGLAGSGAADGLLAGALVAAVLAGRPAFSVAPPEAAALPAPPEVTLLRLQAAPAG